MSDTTTTTKTPSLDRDRIQAALTMVHHSEKKEGRENAAKDAAFILALTLAEENVLRRAVRLPEVSVASSSRLHPTLRNRERGPLNPGDSGDL
jgi:hypothetical protein